MEKEMEQLPEAHGKIIRAATVEFSEKGFAGARMDAIAKRAGVNKAMLYYHIGDKKALYAAVLHIVFASMAKMIEARIDEGKDPETNLRVYIQAIAANVEKNPNIRPIMLREIAQGGKNLPELVIQDFFRLFGVLTKILQKGMAEDRFDPFLSLPLHMMIIGPIIFYDQMKPMVLKFAEGMKNKGFHPDAPVAMGELVEDMILKAVLKK